MFHKQATSTKQHYEKLNVKGHVTETTKMQTDKPQLKKAPFSEKKGTCFNFLKDSTPKKSYSYISKREELIRSKERNHQRNKNKEMSPENVFKHDKTKVRKIIKDKEKHSKSNELECKELKMAEYVTSSRFNSK